MLRHGNGAALVGPSRCPGCRETVDERPQPLDELCTRYGVDRSRRTQHGALVDDELMAAVYVELTTTRQAALQLAPIAPAPSNIQAIVRARPAPLPLRVTADDRNAHRAFVQTLGSGAIWLDCFTIRSVAA
jgi:DNA polymerase III subunit epsilon